MRFHSGVRHNDCCCLHRLHRIPRESNRIEHAHVTMSEGEKNGEKKNLTLFQIGMLALSRSMRKETASNTSRR
jgi:hypothetical protein